MLCRNTGLHGKNISALRRRLTGTTQFTSRLSWATGSDPLGVRGRERPVFPPAEMGSTVMARFYFPIEDDRTHIAPIGVELPELEAAPDEARTPGRGVLA